MDRSAARAGRRAIRRSAVRLKDLAAEVAGTRFTEGSRWLANNVSTHDQELALRYRQAGLVLIGKANTCEFGLKPTRGRVPLGPEYGDFAAGLCAEHVLTRSVRDSAAVLDAVHGPGLGDPYWAPPVRRPFAAEVGADPGRLRIGVSIRPRDGQHVDPAWSAAADGAAKLLEQLGHIVEETVPDGLTDPAYGPSLGAVFRGLTAWIIGYWVRKLGRPPRGGEIEPQTRAYWESVQGVTASDYLLATHELQRIARKVAGRFENDGLPVGVHLMGRFGDEATLFRLAAQLEQAAPWARLRPGIASGTPRFDAEYLVAIGRKR